MSAQVQIEKVVGGRGARGGDGRQLGAEAEVFEDRAGEVWVDRIELEPLFTASVGLSFVIR